MSTPMTLLGRSYTVCKLLDCCVKSACDSEAEAEWINLSRITSRHLIHLWNPQICSDFNHF